MTAAEIAFWIGIAIGFIGGRNDYTRSKSGEKG